MTNLEKLQSMDAKKTASLIFDLCGDKCVGAGFGACIYYQDGACHRPKKNRFPCTEGIRQWLESQAAERQ